MNAFAKRGEGRNLVQFNFLCFASTKYAALKDKHLHIYGKLIVGWLRQYLLQRTSVSQLETWCKMKTHTGRKHAYEGERFHQICVSVTFVFDKLEVNTSVAKSRICVGPQQHSSFFSTRFKGLCCLFIEDYCKHGN